MLVDCKDVGVRVDSNFAQGVVEGDCSVKGVGVIFSLENFHLPKHVAGDKHKATVRGDCHGGDLDDISAFFRFYELSS